MAEAELDRAYAATPYKLGKARERGQVPKSADVTAAAVFLAAMLHLSWYGWPTWQRQFWVDRGILSAAAQGPAPWRIAAYGCAESLRLAAPFLLVLVAVAVAVNLLQSGPVLSLEPVKPDWSRLSPIAGAKRVWNGRTLFNAARAILKLGILGGLAAWALLDVSRGMARIGGLPAAAMTRALLDEAASLGIRLAVGMVAIGLVDLAYGRRDFAKQMRMSRRELRDEVKQREGDPRVRARLREIRRELLKRALALKKASRADVLITNPTHVAVALRYEHGAMDAPEVVAKGAGLLAAALRAVAGRHRIPVVQNPGLARALYREVPLDGVIGARHFAEVAKIIAWVTAIRGARRSPSAGRGGA